MGASGAGGNPTVLLVPFTPDEKTMFRNEVGAELVTNAHRFVSRQAGERFLGYLRAQKAAMTGEGGAHTDRPELVAVHGYDTKYAMHALRLGLQGVELLSTGRITLPVPQPDREYLRSIRRGEVELNAVIEAVESAERDLERLRDTSSSHPIRIAAGSMNGCIAATSTTGTSSARVSSRGDPHLIARNDDRARCGVAGRSALSVDSAAAARGGSRVMARRGEWKLFPFDAAPMIGGLWSRSASG